VKSIYLLLAVSMQYNRLTASNNILLLAVSV